MSNRSQIEEIKKRLDIIEVVRTYVPTLKKSGANHFGLCPFHNEKTPSFSVNSDLGIFKCFGCSESGDVITFLEKVEGLDFPQALELAAEKAGVKLEKGYSKGNDKLQKLRERILEANKLAAKFFHHMLTKHEAGAKAREYVKLRKIRSSEIVKFELGYAPDSFNSLLGFLKKKGFNDKELVVSGLAAEKNGRIYDKFRARLIFPVHDLRGNIVGFSARLISPDAKGPKYLNSPETVVYNKSFLLYGLYQGRESVRKSDFAIISEGQIDILSSYKAGTENIVAPLGTALTEPQLKLLKRYATSIAFAFDSDLAGEKALLRSTELAHRTGLEVKVINLGEFQDADELISSKPKQWTIAVRKAEPIIDHMIRRLSKRIDIGQAKGKAEFAKEILPMVRSLSDKILQSHYIKKVSVLLDTNEEVLREEVDQLEVSATEELQEKIDFTSRPETLNKEEYVLALILQNLERVKKEIKDIEKLLNPISSPMLQKIAGAALKYKEIENMDKGLEEVERTLFNQLSLIPIPLLDDGELAEEIRMVLNHLNSVDLKTKIRELKLRISKAEATGEDMEKLMVEFNDLTKSMKSK